MVGVVTMLAGADAFLAARAGAALAPTTPRAAAAPTTFPREPTLTPAQKRRIVIAMALMGKAQERAAKLKPAAPKPKLAPPMPKPAASKPKLAPPKPPVATVASIPTGCAAVVASVVWPSGWQTICAGARSGLLGLTSPKGNTTLYVRAGETDAFLRSVALHEAGHAWDFARLDATKIAQWCAARGCDAAHFFSGGKQGPGWSEPGGAEDWAASWDACHGGDYHRAYLGLSPPSPEQCRLQNTLVGYPA